MSHKSFIFAHRGARMVSPENTLPAFERALEMGVAGIELDVHASKDHQLVVIHDFTVNKTTNQQGWVRDFTAAELAKMDAGSHLDRRFAGIGVPTLEEVFDLVVNRCRVNVEIKNESPTGGHEVDLLAAMIQRRNLYDQVIVSSFNPITLIRMRATDPKIALGFLYEAHIPKLLEQIWFTPLIQPQALHPYHKLIDASLVAFARSKGCAVNTWTVNDPNEARRLAELGVDVIMSDVPDQIMQALYS